ncbi:hypothetical protein SDC9_61089 [bioreactor metagenome]|uniref:Uncharacterized protein n=1 Tax=bioreactor metagenome TaxID=1076179 RepID=A0A644XEV6_9ZZZZ
MKERRIKDAVTVLIADVDMYDGSAGQAGLSGGFVDFLRGLGMVGIGAFAVEGAGNGGGDRNFIPGFPSRLHVYIGSGVSGMGGIGDLGQSVGFPDAHEFFVLLILFDKRPIDFVDLVGHNISSLNLSWLI